MADKKILTTESMVSDRAMYLLHSLYENKKLVFDEKNQRIIEKFSGNPDKVRKFLLDTMTQRASAHFLDNKGTYASSLFSVSQDFLEELDEGKLPGFDKKEEVLSFFTENQKDLIKKAERICEAREMFFEDIPGFKDSDRRIKTEENKLAVIQFVLKQEAWNLCNEMREFRNELETIPHLSVKKDRMRNPLKQSVLVKQDAEISR